MIKHLPMLATEFDKLKKSDFESDTILGKIRDTLKAREELQKATEKAANRIAIRGECSQSTVDILWKALDRQEHRPLPEGALPDPPIPHRRITIARKTHFFLLGVFLATLLLSCTLASANDCVRPWVKTKQFAALSQPMLLADMVIHGPVGGVTYCATCTGTSDADIICEDWEGADQCVWTDIVVGGSSLDHANATSAGIGCTGQGSSDLKAISAGNNCYVSLNSGSEKTNVFFLGYFYLVSAPQISGNYSYVMLNLTAGGSYVFGLIIYNNLGNLRFMTWHVNLAGAGINTEITSDNVSLGTWYPLAFEWHTGNHFRFYVDWNNDGDFVDANETAIDTVDISNTLAVQTYHFGARVDFGTESITAEWEGMKIDDDTMPNLCGR